MVGNEMDLGDPLAILRDIHACFGGSAFHYRQRLPRGASQSARTGVGQSKLSWFDKSTGDLSG